MTPSDLSILRAAQDSNLIETCELRFKTKKPVEILIPKSQHPKEGREYQIQDGNGRYATVRVDKFSRIWEGQDSYWCTVLKLGWLS